MSDFKLKYRGLGIRNSTTTEEEGNPKIPFWDKNIRLLVVTENQPVKFSLTHSESIHPLEISKQTRSYKCAIFDYETKEKQELNIKIGDTQDQLGFGNHITLKANPGYKRKTYWIECFKEQSHFEKTNGKPGIHDLGISIILKRPEPIIESVEWLDPETKKKVTKKTLGQHVLLRIKTKHLEGETIRISLWEADTNTQSIEKEVVTKYTEGQGYSDKIEYVSNEHIDPTTGEAWKGTVKSMDFGFALNHKLDKETNHEGVIDTIIYLNPAWATDRENKDNMSSGAGDGILGDLELCVKIDHPRLPIYEEETSALGSKIGCFYGKYLKVDDDNKVLETSPLEKSRMLSEIQDVTFFLKGNAPCKFSGIEVVVCKDTKELTTVIFNEDEKNVYDNTNLTLGLTANDKPRTVKIKLLELENKGVRCDSPRKHSKIENVFQIDNAKLLGRGQNSPDYHVIDHSKKEQNFKEITDYDFEGSNTLKLKLPYYYNKTLSQNTILSNGVTVNLWLFNYFWLSENLSQEYSLPVSTCRYPNQLVKLKVYPDIKWQIKLTVSSSVPNQFRSSGMPPGYIRNTYNNLATKVTRNRTGTETQGVYFELTINAKTGDIDEDISIGFEKKIRTFIKLIMRIKEGLDCVFGFKEIDSSVTRGFSKKIFNAPVSLQIDYPEISISGDWKFENKPESKKIQRTGNLSINFEPLIKAEGKIDLIACLEKSPVAPIFIAARRIIELIERYTSAKLGMSFNIYAFGEVNTKLNLNLGSDSDSYSDINANNIDLGVTSTIGFGVEIAIIATMEATKISFSGKIQASGKAETSVTFGGSRGYSNDGIYLELNATFNGIICSITLNVELDTPIGSFNHNKNAREIELVKPSETLTGKYYIIKNS